MTRIIGRLLVALAAAVVPVRASAQTETVTYYHTDAIGSVRMVTDATGAVLARYDYQPFGLALDQVPPPPVEQRQFAGKERDAETGFDYFGGRYYAGLTGRFTTVDPVLNVEAALIDPQRWNRYTYVANRPLAYVDPDGRDLFLASRYSQAQFAQNAEIRQRAYIAVGATPDANPLVRFLGQFVVDSILGTYFPVNTSEEAAAATGALMGTGMPMGGAVRGGARRLADEAPELIRDTSGKVHGLLPKIETLKKASMNSIAESVNELKESIRIRKLELKRLGEHGPHRRRLGEEERLLRSLEGYLEDRYGAKNQP